MALYDKDKIIDALAIRDTTLKTSIISNNQATPTKTIAICNKLNQTVTCQLQGSFEEAFTEVFNIGSSFNVNASTNDWQNASVYFPWLRVTAQCGTSPTTGTLTVFLLKAG